MPEQLKKVRMPAEIMYLYDRWREVFDGDVLTFQKVNEFDKAMRYGMEPWEVRVLFKIDQVYWRIREKNDG